MIRHYDIATGEEIGETLGVDPVELSQHVAETVAPRLITVREAAQQARDAHVPAGIAMLPVETILESWS